MENTLPEKLRSALQRGQDAVNELAKVGEEAALEMERLLRDASAGAVPVNQAPADALDAVTTCPPAEPAAPQADWQAAQGERDESVVELARSTDPVAELHAQLQLVRREKEELQAGFQDREQSLKADEAVLERREQAARLEMERSERLRKENEEARNRLELREQSLLAERAELDRREQAVQECMERNERIRCWLEGLLPKWMGSLDIAARLPGLEAHQGSLSLRDALVEDAKGSDAASNAAGLLFATLSLYTYAQRDTDIRAVADALRDVGRRLFAWLKEKGIEDYASSALAQEVGECINRECSGRCEVEVPVPGAPAQNQTMLYQPRPGVSAQSVTAVQSWCVRGTKREVIHRAAVSV